MRSGAGKSTRVGLTVDDKKGAEDSGDEAHGWDEAGAGGGEELVEEVEDAVEDDGKEVFVERPA